MVGAGLTIAAFGFTIAAIRPVNNRLLATDPETARPETRTLMTRWGQLHAVRTILGLASLILFVWAAATQT